MTYFPNHFPICILHFIKPTDSPTEYPTESPTEYPTESPTNGPPFYPDWTGSDTCVNDRKTPQYMLANPAQWLYYTIEACCDYYQFKKDECINNANPSGSNMWYVDWDSEMCVKDCASSSSDLNVSLLCSEIFAPFQFIVYIF